MKNIIVLILVSIVLMASTAHAELYPDRLRCEYLENPLGIDVKEPRLSWILQARDMSERGHVQSAYHILVASCEDSLTMNIGDLWDSGRIDSDQNIHIVYKGNPLQSRMQCFWKVRVLDKNGIASPWSNSACWSMGLLEKKDWQAEWIIAPTYTFTHFERHKGYHNYDPIHRLVDGANPEIDMVAVKFRGVPLIRKDFSIDAPIKRATAYITALGCYKLHINGKPVGDNALPPEWTHYEKRLLYQTYDVTDLLQQGKNAAGILVADGWYRMQNMYRGIEDVESYWGDGIKRVLAQIEIEQTNGLVFAVATDESWKVCTDGPILSARMYHGVYYDARKEKAVEGWDMPDFKDESWEPAVANQPPSPLELSAQMSEPIKIIKELTPVSMSEPERGVYIFDIGQLISGFCRVTLDGPAGSTVRVRHSEMLESDGKLHTANLGGAYPVDTYILNGIGPQEFEPGFMYHGFRYIEITGLPSKPSLSSLKALVVCSSLRQAGKFESSDRRLTKLWQNVVWTYRGNSPSVITDCAGRNERYGWMGDGQESWQSFCFALDAGAFGTKWIRDMKDSQREDGLFSIFAPYSARYAPRIAHAPAWSDAGVIIPWTMYVNYGDHRLLEASYHAARRYIDAILRDNPDYIWKNNLGNHYGDWLDAVMVSSREKWQAEPNPTTVTTPAIPHEIFSTAFWAYSSRLVSKMASALGGREDAAYYDFLSDNISSSFREAFIREDGSIECDTQSAYALAIYFGLYEGDDVPRALDHLFAAIKKHGEKLSTGIHGSKPLLFALSQSGNHHTAYDLAMNPEYPSWRNMVDNGATTIWERFDGCRADLGINTAHMNDFSHVGLSSVGEWIWKTIAGINPDEKSPGYKHFEVKPCVGANVTWAKGTYNSMHGAIVSDWKIEKGKFFLTVTVPPNTSATVFVPTKNAMTVQESGKPVSQATGVTFQYFEDGKAMYTVVSGTYSFEADLIQK